ncbi:MAG: RNA polymerase factor sigma-54 [Thermoanaerobaculales bacterium]|jgi:RNA polymerase sigma-54 factor|nr:RNA polymerase factor sigma-54 [Thermoanaerobaculales bacterium]
MALEQKLRLKLAQRLVMTPSLQQAIKLLQLSRLELEETLGEEILENPMLEVEDEEEDADEGRSADAETPSTDSTSEGEGRENTAANTEGEDGLPTEEEAYQDIDVEAFFSDYLADHRPEGPSMAASDPGSSVPLENVLSVSGGLSDHLLWQLHLSDCDARTTAVAEYIIGNLDEDGFLHGSDEEIAAATGAGVEEVQKALAFVRSLDPSGVGSRTLQECLVAQIRQLQAAAEDPEEIEVLTRAHRVVSEHWGLFLNQRWEKLAAAQECEIASLKDVVEVIKRLEPKPGRMFHQDRNQYIEPDVHIRKVDGEYTIHLNDDGLPRLRISSRYARMLEGSVNDPQVAGYLREKMRSAVWLMKSIDQRQRTIYKVAQSIVNFQKSFLDHGIEHLKPMVLRQVAEDIGMHESTISRVVSNKYMYTPRGLFPMKYFFHSGVDSARGENVSSLVVKERIKKLVEAEDPVRPLSDSKIMRMLQREGIRLARRTVAKYREEMAIPSSDKRKKVF